MAKELSLKYGCNPNQKAGTFFMQEGCLSSLNGVEYINFMDALNGWQLVKELKEATECGRHFIQTCEPGRNRTIRLELDETLKKIYFVDNLPLSPLPMPMYVPVVPTVCLLMAILSP